jgi:hypothetical protein
MPTSSYSDKFQQTQAFAKASMAQRRGQQRLLLIQSALERWDDSMGRKVQSGMAAWGGSASRRQLRSGMEAPGEGWRDGTRFREAGEDSGKLRRRCSEAWGPEMACGEDERDGLDGLPHPHLVGETGHGGGRGTSTTGGRAPQRQRPAPQSEAPGMKSEERRTKRADEWIFLRRAKNSFPRKKHGAFASPTSPYA